MYALRASAREGHGKRDEAKNKTDDLQIEVRATDEKLKIELKKKDDRVAKLEGQVNETKVELNKKSNELAKEISLARDDGAI